MLPHLGDDRGTREGASGIPHQVLEERKLARAQRDRAVSTPHFARQRIEEQISHPQLCRTRPECRAPQQCAHTRQQLLGVERLRQVVVGAGLQARYAIGDTTARCEHQHRSRDPASAELRGNLQPIAARKTEVEDHQIGRFLECAGEPGVAVRCGLHVKAMLAKDALEQGHNFGAIFNDEDSRNLDFGRHRAPRLRV